MEILGGERFAQHGGTSCRRINAHQSFRPFFAYVAPTGAVRILSTTAGSSNADSDFLRRELKRVHAEFNVATADTSAFRKQHGWADLNYQATAQTQADMLHEFFRTGRLCGNTVSNQQPEILNQMNWVAEHAMQGQRSMLMSEEIADKQERRGSDLNWHKKSVSQGLQSRQEELRQTIS